jgi:hypothetical protein
LPTLIKISDKRRGEALAQFISLTWIKDAGPGGGNHTPMSNTAIFRSERRSRRAEISPDGSRRRRRNWLQIVFLLLMMGALLGFCGWIVAGPDGFVWSVLVGTVSLMLVRRVPVDEFLTSIGARPIAADDVAGLEATFAASSVAAASSLAICSSAMCAGGVSFSMTT